MSKIVPLHEAPDLEDDLDIESEGESDIIEPFDPTKINIISRSLTLDLIIKRIRYGEIDLKPDFQRQPDIWTDGAKSRLIESILIRIPLPAFYIDATNDEEWIIVDGLQRLSTLRSFVIDQSLQLIHLEYLKDLEGKKYNELSRVHQRRIEETSITIYLIQEGTPEEATFNIFKRINTGGLPLSDQEIRNALNQGEGSKFLADLADSQEFGEATGITKKGRDRMGDQEFILRFIAFRLFPSTGYDAKTLDIFLNNAMKRLGEIGDDRRSRLKAEFKQSMILARKLFGKHAFRKRTWENPDKRNPLNKALFDTWSVILSQLTLEECESLLNKGETLMNQATDLMTNDDRFMVSVSQGTGKVDRVKYRFTKIHELVSRNLK